MFYQDERLLLLIDGANLYMASKTLGFEIDYRLLRREFAGRGRLLQALYYTTLVESDDHSPLRPLIDWLYYNGYQMRVKNFREFQDGNERRKFKGGIEVDLTVDALEQAPYCDHIVLFSGDGNYATLVAALQRRGTRVTVVSTMNGSQPMISDDLRRQADHFIELDELRDVIGRPERVEQ